MVVEVKKIFSSFINMLKKSIGTNKVTGNIVIVIKNYLFNITIGNSYMILIPYKNRIKSYYIKKENNNYRKNILSYKDLTKHDIDTINLKIEFSKFIKNNTKNNILMFDLSGISYYSINEILNITINYEHENNITILYLINNYNLGKSSIFLINELLVDNLDDTILNH